MCHVRCYIAVSVSACANHLPWRMWYWQDSTQQQLLCRERQVAAALLAMASQAAETLWLAGGGPLHLLHAHRCHCTVAYSIVLRKHALNARSKAHMTHFIACIQWCRTLRSTPIAADAARSVSKASPVCTGALQAAQGCRCAAEGRQAQRCCFCCPSALEVGLSLATASAWLRLSRAGGS